MKWPRIKRPKPIKALMAAWTWLRTRRAAGKVASAIASNQVATAALATSLAAAGIGGVAGYQNVQQGHQIDAQATRLGTLEFGLADAVGNLEELRTGTAEMNARDDESIRALGKAAAAAARKAEVLAEWIAVLPPGVDLAPLAARIVQLSKDTAEAARLAQQAIGTARGTTDSEARAAADAASVQAAAATTKAERARITAEDAELYAPRVHHLPDLEVAADTGEVLVGRVQTDLTGEYRITLSGDGQGLAYNWQLNGATMHLSGTLSDTPQHQMGATTYVFTGPLPIDITASASGGDSTKLTNIVLILAKVRP